MTREEIRKILERATGKKAKIERPVDEGFGDYSTNLAMVEKINAPELVDKIKDNPIFEKVEIKNGFINFFLSKEYLQEEVREILKKGEEFGQLKISPPKFLLRKNLGGQAKLGRVNVEFISANPTGPLTLGNGRGGFCGDALANVLEKAGYKVEREYYINDIGEQIRKLGHSVLGDSEAMYKGKYIEDLGKRIKGIGPDEVGERAAKVILEEMIKPTVKKMGIRFDKWFSEKWLHKKSKVDKVLKWLKKKGLAYEKAGALWFASSKFSDDKDRVLVKADGEKTYFASDIAYLKNKFERGFDLLVYFLGADHYGYVGRLGAAVQALGYKKEQAKFIVMQLVRLFEKGQKVRMSKREGVYVTLDELIDQVGLDVARFFFLQRSPGSHLNFNLSLAKEQSEKNPVYYVQYAHARICSIIKKSKIKNQKSKIHIKNQKLKLLEHPSELKLIKQLIRFPEIIEDTARDYQVQRLPQYAMDLATALHQFYTECRVLTDNKELSEARLALVWATKIVLKNTLALMGISTPEKM